MLKLKNFVIIVLIYLLSFLAIKNNVNLFYPFYLLKDMIFYPAYAISGGEEVSEVIKEGLSKEQQKEFEELKKLNDLSSTLTDFSTVKAMVIDRNKMYWFNTITINKGSLSNLKEDMAVVSGSGLIGRISKVSLTTSEVKLITTSDINNKISVLIKSGSETIYGLMSLYDSDNNLLEVTLTNKLSNIEKDSFVYTTGLGGIFPSGILIGQVKDIKDDKYEVSKIVEVEPSTNFNDFRFVNVLIRDDTK